MAGRRIVVEMKNGAEAPGFSGCAVATGKNAVGAATKEGMSRKELLVDALEPAYVLPVFDTGNNNSNGAFIYNMTDAQLPSQGSNNRGTTAEADDYWVAYVQGGYKGDTGDDNDPDTEGATVGESTLNVPEYAFAYLGVIRDLCEIEHPKWDETLVERRTVVHEIRHQFGLGDHPIGACVMNGSTNPTVRTSSFLSASWRITRTFRSRQSSGIDWPSPTDRPEEKIKPWNLSGT
jgi:hypothetical protein